MQRKDAPKKATKLHYQMKKPTDIGDLPRIEGFDYSDPTLHGYLKALATTGFQASELSRAIDVARMMVREKVTIFLSFTSNMISCGVREQIVYLVRRKLVHVLSTSAGGIEEDALKCRLPFRTGSFHAAGEMLFDAGICRIGNIYTTTEHYAYLELFLQKVFDELYAAQKKDGKPATPTAIAHTIGKHLAADPQFDHETSYLYWAYKNNIPVFCPGIVDGAIGDMLYFYKKKHPDFLLDVSGDHVRIIDLVLASEKTGAILLGGGIAKHYVLNANIFKEGVDYSVYITTAIPYDGSDSGGSPEEAVTWSKIKPRSPRIKVFADASIVFPLLVYGAFVVK